MRNQMEDSMRKRTIARAIQQTTWAFAVTLAIMALFLVAMGWLLGLTGCSQNASPSSSSADDTAQEMATVVEGLTLRDDATVEEQQAALTTLYHHCYATPEILAATMSAFPTTALECEYIYDADAAAIDDVLSWSEDGGAAQEWLLDALLSLLADSNTEVQMYTFAGEAEVYDLRYVDQEQPDVFTPQNMALYLEKFRSEGADILGITVKYEDGVQETGYFMHSQRVIFTEETT